MCHFEVILEKVTYMVIFKIIYILYKYKDKISIFGQLKTGLMLSVTCYLLLSKVLFTNLKSYGRKNHSTHNEARGYKGQVAEVPRY
jgi:hypothetical protein